MNLLLIPLVLGGVFALPFLMAWLEPKQAPPTHRETNRRTGRAPRAQGSGQLRLTRNTGSARPLGCPGGSLRWSYLFVRRPPPPPL